MQNERTVFILTEKLDTHVDAVIGELNRRGAPFFRLNTNDFHTEYEVAFRSDDGSVHIKDLWNRSIIFPDRVYACWYRKPKDTNNPPDVSEKGVAETIQNETLEMLNYLSAMPGIPWYNHPESNRVAQRKFPQIRLARELGLRVPRTLITNDPEEVRRFAAAAPGDLLCKTMKEAGYSLEDESYFIFSRRVTKPELLAHIEMIRLCPTLIQEYIEKAYELRVTIMGDTVFACRLESQEEEAARTDWRRVSPDRIAHTMVTLDEGVETALKQMLRRLGLRFGTFDLIVTPQNEVVFLELNPNGQWYWIELITGAPMASAMADLLLS